MIEKHTYSLTRTSTRLPLIFDVNDGLGKPGSEESGPMLQVL